MMKEHRGESMTEETTRFHMNLMDKGSRADFKSLARDNFHSFDDMKNALVNERESVCSMEDMARALGCTVDDVAAFEQYYSDPTLSEVQEYAMALMERIHIRVDHFHADKSKMYQSLAQWHKAEEVELSDSDDLVNVNVQYQGEDQVQGVTA